MTMISLSATETLLDLLPGRAGARKGDDVPLRLRFLPRPWREAMLRRARRQELEEAFERLSETSAHLLADVGIAAGARAAGAAPAIAWTRALPAPGATESLPLNSGALSRSRRRLMELDDRLLRDIGVTRAQARREAVGPSWNAPDHWMR